MERIKNWLFARCRSLWARRPPTWWDTWIWTAYLVVGCILLKGFLSLPPDDSLEWRFDLRGFGVIYRVILALIIWGLARGIPFIFSVVLAAVIVHPFWVVFGALIFWLSVRRTWWLPQEHEVFEMDGSPWTKLQRNQPSEAENLIELNGEYAVAGKDNIDVKDRCNIGSESNAEVENTDNDNEFGTRNATEDLYPEHLRLHRNSPDIRLLRPVDQMPDHFELIHTRTHRNPQRRSTIGVGYIALSYFWGPRTPTKRVHIRIASYEHNGRSTEPGEFKDVDIRENLYDALDQLVKKNYTRIWTDAICINQCDPEELSAQIPRMKAIFNSAKMVVAWIPEELRGQPSQWSTHTSSNPSATLTNSVAVQAQSGSEAEADPVLMNEYWRRVWIMQEIAVAKDVKIFAKNGVMDYGQICKLAEQATSAHGENTVAAVNNALGLRQTWRDLRTDGQPSLLELLLRTQGSKCRIWKDRVYGILSMSKDGEKLIMDPKYDETIEREMSLDLLYSYIQIYKKFDICLLGAHFTGESDLPTWCPRFFRFPELLPNPRLPEYVCDVLDPDANRPVYSATGNTSSRDRWEDTGTLFTPAYNLGPIESLGWIPSDKNMLNYPCRRPQVEIDSKDIDIPTALWKLMETISRRDSLENRLQYRKVVSEPKRNMDYERCLYPYNSFMLAVFNGRKLSEEEGLTGGLYAQWLQANQNFHVGQHTLREHARKTWAVLTRPRFWKWVSSIWNLPAAPAIHTDLWDLDRVHRPLKTIAKHRMRLMCLAKDGKGIIGLAHENARPDDEVFLIPGCTVPAILRRRPHSDQYSVIGDAVVPGEMCGESYLQYVGCNPDPREIEIV